MDLDQLKQILLSGNKEKSYGVQIDFLAIAHDAPSKAQIVIDKGPNFEAKSLYPIESFAKDCSDYILPKIIYSRFCNMEPIFGINYHLEFQIGWICFKGTILRCGAVQSHEKDDVYQCQGCRDAIMSPLLPDLFNKSESPRRCKNLKSGEVCGNVNFKKMESIPTYIDYQEIKVQEHPHIVTDKVPKNIAIILQNDLVDKCQPGDAVLVTGHMRRRFKMLFNKPYIEWYILANNILVENSKALNQKEQDMNSIWRDCPSDFDKRKQIVNSFCPNILGLQHVKLALLLVLIGGVSRNTDNKKLRGESHILLVGHPGTAKSRFLQTITRIIPRSVLTTGLGSTRAGLTVTALKEGGQWVLEAGALVLADKGVCCIDEFTTIKKEDQISIHEAMEQQTLSVAKAGMQSTLNTRCSIIAACNPNYKKSIANLAENLNLATSLISRFDFIFMLDNHSNATLDAEMADFILEREGKREKITNCMFDENGLSLFISHVKEKYFPKCPSELTVVFKKYYAYKRNDHNFVSQGRATIRMVESLLRISEAHAKLCFRQILNYIDVFTAIILMEVSDKSYSMFNIVADASFLEKSQFDKYVKEICSILELDSRGFGCHI